MMKEWNKAVESRRGGNSTQGDAAAVRDQDVLSGRGGLSNKHPGNQLFRRIVAENRDIYQNCSKKTHKYFLALSIVSSIEMQGGRFLKQEGGKWVKLSRKEAFAKTSQALREQDFKPKRFHAPEPSQRSLEKNSGFRYSKSQGGLVASAFAAGHIQNDGNADALRGSDAMTRRRLDASIVSSLEASVVMTADVGIPHELFDARMTDFDDGSTSGDDTSTTPSSHHDEIVLFPDELDDLLLQDGLPFESMGLSLAT